MPFQIIRGNITQVNTDAIVNTVNPEATIGAGVETAIYEAAGKEKLLAARKKIGRLFPGEACVTPGFDLPAKYIIHSCCASWVDGKSGEREFLRYCYEKALHIAEARHCKSIAFPLMSTGFYGYPKEIGMDIAVKAFEEFLQDHEMEITLVVFDTYEESVSGSVLSQVQSFVSEHVSPERTSSPALWSASARETTAPCSPFVGKMVMGMAPNRKQTCLREASPKNVTPKNVTPEEACPEESCLEEACPTSSAAKDATLDEQLKQMYTDSFEKHLQQLINKKHMKNSEVYAAANISKQYFSKLMKGQVKPSKEKVLSLAIGLRLNLDETIDFLRIAGYALSPVSQTDVIVEYFIRQEEYSVIKIDIVLFDYGLPLLSE